jgi:hypothetical protein
MPRLPRLKITTILVDHGSKEWPLKWVSNRVRPFGTIIKLAALSLEVGQMMRKNFWGTSWTLKQTEVCRVCLTALVVGRCDEYFRCTMFMYSDVMDLEVKNWRPHKERTLSAPAWQDAEHQPRLVFAAHRI